MYRMRVLGDFKSFYNISPDGWIVLTKHPYVYNFD